MNDQGVTEVDTQTKDAQLTQAGIETEALKNQIKLTNELALARLNQATARFNLAAEQAKSSFAELSGIKAATAGMELPTGKSGTVQVAAGTAGTTLLRSKGPMLQLLDDVADEFVKQLPNGAVIITDSQLEQAYHAEFITQLIEKQTKDLTEANKQARPVEITTDKLGSSKTFGSSPLPITPAGIAMAYSAGLILDTANSLGKLFRVDRKVDIFAADAEAGQMLGYLLEAKNVKFIANPTAMRKEVLDETNRMLKILAVLLKGMQASEATLEQSRERGGENVAKNNPTAENVAELKAQLISAKSLFESLDPSKMVDQFRAQVKGQLLSVAIKDRDRLLIEAKGQALQITESRWYKSDCMNIGGEVQIAYRMLNKDGGLIKSGVILRASKVEKTRFDQIVELVF